MSCRIKMFNFDITTNEYTLICALSSVIVIMYSTIIYSMYNDNINDNNNDKKFDRVINIINSSMKGEFENLKKVYDNENPYDLFTRIYPTLKEMDNKCIDELIDILSNYNSNWISNDDN